MAIQTLPNPTSTTTNTDVAWKQVSYLFSCLASLHADKKVTLYSDTKVYFLKKQGIKRVMNK